MKTLEEWRGDTGIELGMTKEEAFEKFMEWQGKVKTCQRCREELYQYKPFCRVKSICEEAEHGNIQNRPIILRKEPCGSIRNLKIKSLRITPKRGTVG